MQQHRVVGQVAIDPERFVLSSDHAEQVEERVLVGDEGEGGEVEGGSEEMSDLDGGGERGGSGGFKGVDVEEGVA